MYHYHQQHHAPPTPSLSSMYYCKNDTASRPWIPPSIVQPSVASGHEAMLNAHGCSVEKREEGTADYYRQYHPVIDQNTLHEDKNLNSLSGAGREEREEPRRNSHSRRAYSMVGEHDADGRNACGDGTQARARYIKIRNDEDNYYNDNNNNCNDNESSSSIQIGKVKRGKKRT